MDVLLLLPFRDDAEEATLLGANDELLPTSSARSCATLVWRTTSRACGGKIGLSRMDQRINSVVYVKVLSEPTKFLVNVSPS